MKFAAASDTGKKYQQNEDRFTLPQPNEKYGIKKIDAENSGRLFCLCDGMGGTNSGEVAALEKQIAAVADKTHLQLKIGDNGVHLTLLLKPEITINRMDDDVKPDIAFDDRRISRNHAVIRWADGD